MKEKMIEVGVYYNPNPRKEMFAFVAIVSNGPLGPDTIEDVIPMLWFDEQGNDVSMGMLGGGLLQMDENFMSRFMPLVKLIPATSTSLPLLKEGKAKEALALRAKAMKEYYSKMEIE